MSVLQIPRPPAYTAPVLKTRLERSLRATWLGLVVNMVFSAVKLVAGIAGHSHALVADAVESMADVFSSVIVWRGLVVASEPEDEDHPYGHGKAEPLSAAIVSAMLLGAAVWIMATAVREIRHPHQGPAAFTLLVLVLVVLIKEALFRHVLRESAAVESTAVQTDAWHHRSDAITSFAAALGIGVALIGGRGYEAADDYAAGAAALVIAWNGYRLLRNAIRELMDTSPKKEVVDRIREAARGIRGVDFVEKCFARKMGYSFYVDMHVQVDPKMTVERSHEIAHQVKDTIRREFPRVRDVLVHIEPTGHTAHPSSSSS